jgi:hypothetical protein
MLLRVMVAPGTARCCSSYTVPETVARVDCALTVLGTTNIAAARRLATRKSGPFRECGSTVGSRQSTLEARIERSVLLRPGALL